MARNYFNDYTRFKGLYNDLKNRSHYRSSNKKSIEIIRDIEILKIKLVEIDNYLDGKDIFDIISYLGSINYNSNLDNFILEKPEVENFWLTIWKYQEHSSENEIVVKIAYRRSTSNYNAYTNYTESVEVYSPCVYSEVNLLISYFADYILPIIMSKDKRVINPIKFIN